MFSISESITSFFNKHIKFARIFSNGDISQIDVPEEIIKNEVKIKFKISKFNEQNNKNANFIEISIPYQFIKQFEPYRHLINHPTLRGKKICEWDVCGDERILSFSSEETNFVIENAIKEIKKSIRWIKDEDEYPTSCTEKTITFEW